MAVDHYQYESPENALAYFGETKKALIPRDEDFAVPPKLLFSQLYRTISDAPSGSSPAAPERKFFYPSRLPPAACSLCMESKTFSLSLRCHYYSQFASGMQEEMDGIRYDNQSINTASSKRAGIRCQFSAIRLYISLKPNGRYRQAPCEAH